ncbi:MAG: hypothetical protein N2688_06675 [Burkholderiaceae bacterium]|nr:hypothetical protein [Burkholderiaceae bacterium]
MRDRLLRGVRGVLLSAWLAAAAMALAPLPVQAQAAASAYRYAVPAGWERSIEGDTEVLVPTAEPAGSAQLLLLAPKPLSGDFFQQFDAERAQLEQFWGLRAPAPVDPQRGSSAEGPWAAYFASYDSDGGPRYMSFLARAFGQRMVLAVFVAAGNDSFNRVAPQATRLFTTLQLAR